MGKLDVKLEGLDDLLKRLDRMAKGAKTALRGALTKAVRPLAKHAKFMTPVRYGLLRRAIGFKIARNKGTLVGLVGVRTGFKRIRKPGLLRKLFRRTVVADALGKKIQESGVNPVRYAHLVELGTSHSPAKPFLRPAWDSGKDQAIDTVAREIRAALEKAAK